MIIQKNNAEPIQMLTFESKEKLCQTKLYFLTTTEE